MARYDDSWRTDVKSMFAPLPLEFMQLKLDEKQQERDYLESQINGDYDFSYDPLLLGDKGMELAEQRKQQYRTDMDNIRNSLTGAIDLTESADQIRELQRKYNLIDKNGINVDNSSGSGNGSGNQNYGTAGFGFNTPEYIAQENYKRRLDADELYNKDNNPYAQSYRFVNIVMKANDIRNQTGGDYTQQPLIDYVHEEPLNPLTYYDMKSQQANRWNPDGGANTIPDDEFAGYMTTYHETYIVGGPNSELYQAMYGSIMGDPEWNRFMEVTYMDRSLNPNTTLNPINPDAYADFYIENELAKPENKNKTKDELINEFMATTGMSKEQAMFQLGLEGYKMDEANRKAMEFTDQEDFYNRTENIKASEELKLANNKRMANYEYDLYHQTNTTSLVNDNVIIDTKELKNNVVDNLTQEGLLKNDAGNSWTELVDTKTNFAINIFGKGFQLEDIIPVDPNLNRRNSNNIRYVDSNGKIISVAKEDAPLQYLMDQGVVVINPTTGIYEYDQNMTDDVLQGITGNDNITLNDLHDGLLELNEAQNKYVSDNNAYIFAQTTNAIIKNSFLQSEEGQDYLNEKYNEYLKSYANKSSTNVGYHNGYMDMTNNTIPVDENGKSLNINDYKEWLMANGDKDISSVAGDKSFNEAVADYAVNNSYTPQVAVLNMTDDNGKQYVAGSLGSLQVAAADPNNLETLKGIDGTSFLDLIGEKNEDWNPDNYKFDVVIKPMSNNTSNSFLQYDISYEKKDDKGVWRKYQETMIVNPDDLVPSQGYNDQKRQIVDYVILGINQNQLEGIEGVDQESDIPKYRAVGDYVINKNALFTEGGGELMTIMKDGEKTGDILSLNNVDYYCVKDGNALRIKYYNNTTGQTGDYDNNTYSNTDAVVTELGKAYVQVYNSGETTKGKPLYQADDIYNTGNNMNNNTEYTRHYHSDDNNTDNNTDENF